MGGIICPPPPPDGVILRPPSSARVKTCIVQLLPASPYCLANDWLNLTIVPVCLARWRTFQNKCRIVLQMCTMHRCSTSCSMFYLHDVQLPLNDEFKPDVDDLFCRSANRSARTTRRGSDFCSCVETVLTIGRFQSKKGVLIESASYEFCLIYESNRITTFTAFWVGSWNNSIFKAILNCFRNIWFIYMSGKSKEFVSNIINGVCTTFILSTQLTKYSDKWIAWAWPHSDETSLWSVSFEDADSM